MARRRTAVARRRALAWGLIVAVVYGWACVLVVPGAWVGLVTLGGPNILSRGVAVGGWPLVVAPSTVRLGKGGLAFALGVRNITDFNSLAFSLTLFPFTRHRHCGSPSRGNRLACLARCSRCALVQYQVDCSYTNGIIKVILFYYCTTEFLGSKVLKHRPLHGHKSLDTQVVCKCVDPRRTHSCL